MKPLNPWFSMPLDSLRRSVRSVTLGVRTLKDPQLEAELAELRSIAAGAPDDLAVHLVAQVYADEQARRVDPLLQFDDELDLVLDRLSHQTNETDRHRLRQIGQELHRLGGKAALSATCNRLMARAPEKRRELFDRIISKWWGSIAHSREVA